MQIHQNVEEILKLHEDLLCQIQHIIREPLTQAGGVRRETVSQSKQHRHSSIEGHRIASAVAGLVHTARTSFESARLGNTKMQSRLADTNRAMEIAKIFGRMTGRLFVYEEYGAKYDLMMRDMASTSKSITNWHAFERSIEALANSLASSSASDEPIRKGLSFGDLLIKPIQRICRYPLLFEELYNTTLESDSAEAHAELRKVLRRLEVSAEETNRATNDPVTQARIQRSWRLQDLLVLPDAVGLP